MEPASFAAAITLRLLRHDVVYPDGDGLDLVPARPAPPAEISNSPLPDCLTAPRCLALIGWKDFDRVRTTTLTQTVFPWTNSWLRRVRALMPSSTNACKVSRPNSRRQLPDRPRRMPGRADRNVTLAPAERAESVRANPGPGGYTVRALSPRGGGMGNGEAVTTPNALEYRKCTDKKKNWWRSTPALANLNEREVCVSFASSRLPT